jgi:hypothetical protein
MAFDIGHWQTAGGCQRASAQQWGGRAQVEIVGRDKCGSMPIRLPALPGAGRAAVDASVVVVVELYVFEIREYKNRYVPPPRFP